MNIPRQVVLTAETPRVLVLTAAKRTEVLVRPRVPATAVVYHVNNEDLPFENASFDRIVAERWIERLRWQRWALQEAVRVLAAGGIFHTYAMRRLSIAHVVARVADAVQNRLFHSKQSKRHSRYLTTAEFQSLAAQCGLESVRPAKGGLGGRFSNFLGAPAWLCPALGLSELCFRKTTPAKLSDRAEFQSPESLAATVRAVFRDWGGRCPAESARSAERFYPSASDGPVLVVAPHPDDELIGCGGTVLRYLGMGVPVHVLFITPGSTCLALRGRPEEESLTIRYDEARRVADKAGFRAHCFPPSTTGIDKDTGVVEWVGEMLKAIRPQLVFAPSRDDLHTEHRITWRMLEVALSTISSKARVFEYAVWGDLDYNRFVDVTECHDVQMNLLMLYRTAMRAVDYVRTCTLLQALRAHTLATWPAYIEVFRESNTNEIGCPAQETPRKPSSG